MSTTTWFTSLVLVRRSVCAHREHPRHLSGLRQIHNTVQESYRSQNSNAFGYSRGFGGKYYSAMA